METCHAARAAQRCLLRISRACSNGYPVQASSAPLAGAFASAPPPRCPRCSGPRASASHVVAGCRWAYHGEQFRTFTRYLLACRTASLPPHLPPAAAAPEGVVRYCPQPPLDPPDARQCAYTIPRDGLSLPRRCLRPLSLPADIASGSVVQQHLFIMFRPLNPWHNSS